MPSSRKADLVAAFTTKKAAEKSLYRSYYCMTPEPGCHRVNWNEPRPLPLSHCFGWTRGGEAKRVRRAFDTEEEAHSAEGIAKLAAAWKHAKSTVPAPSRLEYQQLRNRKAKNKWAVSGRKERGEEDARRAADAANLQ